MKEDKFLTVSETAKRLSISIPTVYRLLKNGKIKYSRPVIKGAVLRKIRIRESDVELFRRRRNET